jgi:hypothetical protein
MATGKTSGSVVKCHRDKVDGISHQANLAGGTASLSPSRYVI